jgi:prepilin-type N-terminal cleavage/methylation domain-containing protein
MPSGASSPTRFGQRRGRGASRGFTMAELLAALAIIGIFAAAASPVFVKLMRDNRVSSAATNFADLFRTARARALGRGSAMLVRWETAHATPTTANPAGLLTVREAIVGTGGDCAPMPAPNCSGTDWGEASTTSKFVMSFDARTRQYQPNAATFRSPADDEEAVAEICFTPRGRTFIRYSKDGAFEALAGVPRIEVVNTATSFRRQVIVPPNGMARVVTTL